MPSRRIADLHPDMQPLCAQFLAECSHQGIKVGISCTYRSDEEQDQYYASGRTIPGRILTNAEAGESPHNCTLDDGTPAAKAFDFFIYGADGGTLDWDATDDRWKAVIGIGTALGLVSGSTFKFRDNDHFELKDW